MPVIIIGKRSNLSKFLFNKITNSVILSAQEMLEYKLDLNEKYNIIINTFQPALYLNDLTNPTDYIENSIMMTAKILNKITPHLINKIIYTSSSSVYGDNIYCRENDNLLPTNLHSALKVSNEKLIEKFCLDNELDYTITRIFNMYGSNDNFSVISKIINNYKNSTVLKVVNNGNSIRDFIYIEDIVNVYEKILNLKNIKILNIGSGNGLSVREVLNFLELQGYKIRTESNNKNEIKTSTASIEILSKIVNINDFTNVKDFILKELIQ